MAAEDCQHDQQREGMRAAVEAIEDLDGEPKRLEPRAKHCEALLGIEELEALFACCQCAGEP
jgi:hypothetical protein